MTWKNKKQKFTVLHRLLHWITALSMLVLLITGFLRMTWMNWRGIVEIMASKTEAIPPEEMKSIAKAIREPMWEWHVFFAHVIIFAFIIRLVYMIAAGIRFPNPFQKNKLLKERFQGFVYIYFYLYLVMAIFTGICLKKGFLPDWKKDIEAIHKLGLYLVPIFILLHFVGIVIGEHSNKKGIISKMIGGEKE